MSSLWGRWVFKEVWIKDPGVRRLGDISLMTYDLFL